MTVKVVQDWTQQNNICREVLLEYLEAVLKSASGFDFRVS